MADARARALGRDMCAFMNQRGMEQAVDRVTAGDAHLTADEREWIEVGVAFGITAAIDSLAEAGWIKGPRRHA